VAGTGGFEEADFRQALGARLRRAEEIHQGLSFFGTTGQKLWRFKGAMRDPGRSVARAFCPSFQLGACLKTPRGPVFEERARWRGGTREHVPSGPVSEEQRSQRALSSKTLRATGLLPVAGVGSSVTAPSRDAPAAPPGPPPKSLLAGPLGVFKQALKTGLPDRRVRGQTARDPTAHADLSRPGREWQGVLAQRAQT
jgi:hypothetical protein